MKAYSSGQTFLLVGSDGRPWKRTADLGSEVSIQGVIPAAHLGGKSASSNLLVRVKSLKRGDQPAAAETEGLRMKVEGMRCEKCASRLQKLLKGTKGVKSVTVDFESKSAVVEIDQDRVSKEEIVATVEEAGFKAIINKNQQTK